MLNRRIDSSPVSSRMGRLKGHHLDQQGIWDCSVLPWKWSCERVFVEVTGFVRVQVMGSHSKSCTS